MPGRNDPCFCGSGKKYKRCHFALEQAAGTRSPLHDLDERISASILRFGAARFGENFARHSEQLPSTLPFDQIQRFAVPFLLYEAPLDGHPVAEWFLREGGQTLSGRERAWIERQLEAWLSIWEITAVEPGRTVSLVDRLTGERRDVWEVSASRELTPLDHVLGRVTEFENSSLLCGMHPYALPPRPAEATIAAMQREIQPGTISIETLRNYESASLLLRRWEQAVARLIEKRSRPPELQNTDEDPFILVVDHFRFDPARRDEINQVLATLEGIAPPHSTGAETEFSILRAEQGTRSGAPATLVGTLTVSHGSLRAQTNSLRRADHLRSRLEALGSTIQHRARELTDPLHDFGKAGARTGASRREDSTDDEAVDQAIRQHKESHYESWLDEPVPALKGKTPRQAVRSKRLRPELELLLREIEHIEGRLPPSQRFDVNKLYRALEMDRKRQAAAPAVRQKTPDRKRDKTRRIIDQICGAGEVKEKLEDLLRKVDPVEARLYLLERLREHYRLADGFTALMILDQIGVGAELPRFSELVLDSTAPVGARAAALNLVSAEDEGLADRLIEQLGPEEGQRLAEEPVREMIRSILVDADLATMPVSFFAESIETGWEEDFGRVESMRREIGLSASAFYEWLIRAQWLPPGMRDEILDALTSEGGKHGAALIEQLREATKDRRERARLQGALTRIRTAAVGGQGAPFPIQGQAFLEPVDGLLTGFSATVVEQTSAREGLMANLAVDFQGRVSGSVGFASPDAIPEFESVDPVARVDAGVAASMVSHALRNRVKYDEHDGGTEAAIRIFQRVALRPVPVPESAENIDRDAFDDLFARKEYESWFFTDEDLNSVKVLIPTIEPDLDWYKGIIAKLNRPKIRRRLRSQIDYMSRWHLLRGEVAEAALMARLSADLDKGFEGSLLVKELLERVVRLHRPIQRKEISAESKAIAEAFQSGQSSADDLMKVLRKIVANQLRLSAPPQVRETLERLQREGIPRATARDMICVALHADLTEALNSDRSYDDAAYIAKLTRLPELPS